MCGVRKNNIKRARKKAQLLNLDVKFTVSLKNPRCGILRHQFNRRLESFAPSYSQSLLLADFRENHTFVWF
jgi:hypothetical protein